MCQTYVGQNWSSYRAKRAMAHGSRKEADIDSCLGLIGASPVTIGLTHVKFGILTVHLCTVMSITPSLILVVCGA